MISEELEFRISQFADGTLPAEEVAALEATLAGDAEARAMLASYRKLDSAIRAEMTTPAMDWDRLSTQISRTIAAHDEAMTTGVWGRIGVWGKMAVAAMILLAIGGAALILLRPGVRTDLAIKPTAHRIELAEVTGPVAESASSVGVEDVAIGPAPSASSASYAAAEDIVYHAPLVVIASSQFQRQDSAALPY